MKLSTRDQQLGWALLLKYAAIQNGKTKNPSKRETGGLDASRHLAYPWRGREKNFLLTSSFIG